MRCSARKRNKPLGPDAPHYPNKEESKELRRLMQLSGDSEEVVRSNPHNRRLLAEASVKSHQLSDSNISIKRARRSIGSALGLPPYDKVVIEWADRLTSPADYKAHAEWIQFSDQYNKESTNDNHN